MDPFAGGSSQLKDTTAAEGDESHRTADGPAAPLPTSKFETRGTPTAAGGQQYTSATLLYQMQALRSKSKQSEPQSQPSPPSATPNSSGEQMPPPPIASQRFATAVAPAKSQNPAPRRSTSSGSASSKTAHSDSDKDKADKKLRATGRQKSRDKSARASSSLKEFLGSRVSALQQQDKQQQPFPSLPSPHKKNSTREKTAAEEAEEDEEETQLVLTEDRPPSSPAVGSYDGAGGEDELIMSGDAAASREREEDSEESSRSSDSSEAEDDDAEDERRIAGVSHLKREREFEEYGDEEEAECKRRNLGQRSQTPEQIYEEYHGATYSQDDPNLSYEPRYPSASTQQQEQQPQYYYASTSPPPQPPQPAFDPLTPVPDLFPGGNPFLQQAQARLAAERGVTGAENKWEGCSLEEWKQGGEELTARFAGLMGRIVQLMAKKSARTEGFKQQMKQHREELQQYETKLESTKQGLAKWAAHVGL